ncbi:MAG: hypothetical protein IEMM0002_0919 [bacterium]|nr:MAG: hypothetical protein IEMM0002_0919 [bacterium]
MSEYIAVFDTAYETLRAEDFFRKEKIKFRPILKPRGIGSSCKMALQFSADDMEPVKRAVVIGNLALAGFFKEESGKWKKIES